MSRAFYCAIGRNIGVKSRMGVVADNRMRQQSFVVSSSLPPGQRKGSGSTTSLKEIQGECFRHSHTLYCQSVKTDYEPGRTNIICVQPHQVRRIKQDPRLKWKGYCEMTKSFIQDIAHKINSGFVHSRTCGNTLNPPGAMKNQQRLRVPHHQTSAKACPHSLVHLWQGQA